MNRREYLFSAVSAATLASASKALARQKNDAPDTEETEQDVQFHYGLKIPMRDGVHLNATLYLPKDMKKPRPVVYALTPYISDAEYAESLYLAQHGYPCLAVDVRGRGNSEGAFTPFFNNPDDAHDIVDWISKQAYCNGKVAGRGLSYVGFTQWAAIRGEARQLATIVPSAPCWVGLDYPMRHNIFYSFLAPWMTFTLGATRQISLISDSEHLTKKYLDFLELGLPFKKLDEFFGLDQLYFEEWMAHPHQDEYWDRANPTPEQFAELDIPVLSLTGIYDGDQPGTLEFHRQHLKYAGRKAKNHYLVIGPWDHAGVRNPAPEFLGVKVGPDSVLDMKKLHREWYDWTMEGGPKPEFLKKKVAYYVMDAEKWRYADKIEDVTSRVETLYLHSKDNPADVFNAGALTPAKPSGQATPDHYVYDPRDLSAPKLESTLDLSSSLPNQTMVVSQAGAKLIYHSAPFEEDTEISGFFKMTAWLSIDQPDTDFSVNIYDIAADGSSLYLTQQNMRARYREGLREEKLIETTEPLRYDFDKFFFVARRIRKGHRLRLVIRPNHTIHWQKNYNSAKPVAEQTMADARTVTVQLYHDADHPSALSVPIGRAEN